MLIFSTTFEVAKTTFAQQGMHMKPAKFFEASPVSGAFHSTKLNRDIPQRAKLEEAILNLAMALGVTHVERAHAQSGTFYRVGPDAFQSASNTILTLSRRVLAKP